GRPLPVDLGQGLGQDGSVMLRQPVTKERVGDPDTDGPSLVGDVGRRLEPGVEAVTVDFGFDPGEDLIPDIPGHFRGFSTFFSTTVENFEGRPAGNWTLAWE